jgi:hypothetical protein
VKAKEGAGKATDLLPRRPKPSQDGGNLEGPANPTRADGSTSVDANRIAASEACGKSRVHLGGLAEELHRRNLRALYQYEKGGGRAGADED